MSRPVSECPDCRAMVDAVHQCRPCDWCSEPTDVMGMAAVFRRGETPGEHVCNVCLGLA